MTEGKKKLENLLRFINVDDNMVINILEDYSSLSDSNDRIFIDKTVEKLLNIDKTIRRDLSNNNYSQLISNLDNLQKNTLRIFFQKKLPSCDSKVINALVNTVINPKLKVVNEVLAYKLRQGLNKEKRSVDANNTDDTDKSILETPNKAKKETYEQKQDDTEKIDLKQQRGKKEAEVEARRNLEKKQRKAKEEIDTESESEKETNSEAEVKAKRIEQEEEQQKAREEAEAKRKKLEQEQKDKEEAEAEAKRKKLEQEQKDKAEAEAEAKRKKLEQEQKAKEEAEMREQEKQERLEAAREKKRKQKEDLAKRNASRELATQMQTFREKLGATMAKKSYYNVFDESTIVFTDNDDDNKDLEAAFDKLGIQTGGGDDPDLAFKRRILIHKLVTNAFSTAKSCKCKPSECDSCKIKKVIIDKYSNDYSNIVLPQYDYVKCLAEGVKNAIEAKQKETPFMKSILTGSQYRYNNYIPYTTFGTFVSLFFNLFFGNSACTLTNIGDSYIKFVVDKASKATPKGRLEYHGDLVELINDCPYHIVIIDLYVPGHANSLIFDKINKKIYRFEPNNFDFLLGKDPHILTQDWFIDNGEYIGRFIDAFLNNKPVDTNEFYLKKLTIKYQKGAFDMGHGYTYLSGTEYRNTNVYHIKLANDDWVKLDRNDRVIDGSGPVTYPDYKLTGKVLIPDSDGVKDSDKYFIYGSSSKLRDEVFDILLKILPKGEKINTSLNNDNKDGVETKPYMCDKLLYNFFKKEFREYRYYPALATVRPDTMIINYSIQNGFDPDGYCQTINYFYMFLLLFDNNSDNNFSLIMAKWITEYNYEVSAGNAGVLAQASSKAMYDETDLARNFVRYLAIIFFQYFYKSLSHFIKDKRTIVLVIKQDDTFLSIMAGLSTHLTTGPTVRLRVSSKELRVSEKVYNLLKDYTSIVYMVSKVNNIVTVTYMKDGKPDKVLELDTKNFWEIKDKITDDHIMMEFARWYLYSEIFNSSVLDEKGSNYGNQYPFIVYSREFIRDQIMTIDKGEHGTRFRKTDEKCKADFVKETTIDSAFMRKYLKYKKKYFELKHKTTINVVL